MNSLKLIVIKRIVNIRNMLTKIEDIHEGVLMYTEQASML